MPSDTITEDLDATATAVPPADSATGDDAPLVEEDLLVEEVSIDGMCGVY
jgi:mycofactocin precursor